MREEEGSGGWWVEGQRDKREETGTSLVAQGLRLCRARGFDPWSGNKKEKKRGRKSELLSGQGGS